MGYNLNYWFQYKEKSLLYQMASSFSSFDSMSSRSSTSTNSSLSSYLSCKRSGRRNAVQLKSHGANFTIKNGQWTLWIDTLTEDELMSFKEAFAMYDKKGKGVIHSRHLGSIMRCLGCNPPESEIADILDELTDGKSNHCHISFPQFVTIMAQKRCSSEEYIRDALEILDDGGIVNYKALTTDLSTIGSRLKPEDIEECFAELELDEDGNLPYDDLVDLISSKPEVYEASSYSQNLEDEEETNNKKKLSDKEYSVRNALKSFFKS